MDTPLNKSGHLQIYIRTAKGMIIEINPSIRIPRTFKRFSGLIAQLLTKHKILADGNTLMKIIAPPLA